MIWTVKLTSKVAKQYGKLPGSIKDNLNALVKEIQIAGPVRGNWPNYSKLSDTEHHCHLKKGKPTYVAVWRVNKKQIKFVEVIYAGTHEKATY